MATEIVYRDADFTEQFKATIKEARDMWEASCIQNFKDDGDNGSCVLGAGIYVMHIAPRCRTPKKLTIISASSVAHAQGSVNWEKGREKIIDFLKEKGIDVGYDWGTLD